MDTVDIAVTGERFTHNMRIFALPEMKAIDNGGIPMFDGEEGLEYRDLMGVALYKRSKDGATSLVSKKQFSSFVLCKAFPNALNLLDRNKAPHFCQKQSFYVYQA